LEGIWTFRKLKQKKNLAKLNIMNVVYQSLGLLLLVTGALSAVVATLGATCAIGDTCSVNAAVCDKASLTCQCQFGYVQSGAICSRYHSGLCGAGMCKSPDKMVCDAAANQCKCDASKGYVVAGTGCGACDTGYISQGGVCKKTNGQTCASGDECHSNLVCSGGTCTCDTSLHYSAGTPGGTTCACDTGYANSNGKCCPTGETESRGICCASGSVESSGVCKKGAGQSCNTAGECHPNLICATTCKCDPSLNYAIASAGATTCSCAATYAMDPSTGTCKKVWGQTCQTGSECLSTLICDTTCKCDTTQNYLAGGAGDEICECAANYDMDSATGTCKKVIGQGCTGSECLSNLICDTTCKCDTNLHYTGTTGGSSCTCNSATFFTAKTGGGCIGKVGAACSAATDCLTGLVCTGSKCACDTTLHYAAGANGASSCTCNSAAFFGSTSGGCIGNVGATCSVDSNCRKGMVCISGKCACDTTKKFVAGSNGASSCTCATGYSLDIHLGNCAINVGGTCTRDAGTYIPCVDDAVCDRATDTCKCDSAAGYMATGYTCDACLPGFTMNNDDRCVADVNGFCIPSTQAGVCVSGATCFAGNSTLDPLCLCDSNQYDYKGSCSGAGGVVASLAGLLMALFMTSRLM